MTMNDAEERRRDELKESLWTRIDNMFSARNESNKAADDLCQQVIQPLCLHNKVDLRRNPPADELLRGQWDAMLTQSVNGRVAIPPAPTELVHVTLGALRPKDGTPSVTLLHTLQEFEPTSKTCNYVILIESRGVQAYCIVYGTYDIISTAATSAATTTLSVTFTRVALRPVNNSNNNESTTTTTPSLQEAYGLDANDALERPLIRTCTASANIMYLDHDTRIQYGQRGGFHVMRLRSRQGKGVSTNFASACVATEEDAPVIVLD